MRYLRVTRPSGGASHVYATPPEEIRVVPLVNEVEGAVERVRAFRDGQIRYFDRDRATGKVVASSAKLSTLHEDLVDAAEIILRRIDLVLRSIDMRVLLAE